MRSLFEELEPEKPAVPARETDPDDDFDDLLSAVHVIRTRYITEEKKSVAMDLYLKLAKVIDQLAKDLGRFK